MFLLRYLTLVYLYLLNVTPSYSLDDLCNPGQSDILFLLDTSTSVQDCNSNGQNQDNWTLILSFVKNLIDNLPFGTAPFLRVGIIPFASQVHSDFNIKLFDTKEDALKNINDLHYRGGNTNISGALRAARLTFKQYQQANRTKKVVLVTDGQSNVDANLTLIEAKLNRAANIKHFIIAITEYVNNKELLEIIDGDPTHYYMGVENFLSLNSLSKDLVERITCYKPPSDGCENNIADICFLLDSSGSIIKDDVKDYTDWNAMKQFLLDMVSSLTIGSDANRVSLVEYSEVAQVIFDLKFSFSADKIKETINNITFLGSETNTADALNKMTREVFIPSRGDRPDVPNIAIVITDGKSNKMQNQTIPYAQIAKNANIRIFAVGLTASIELVELNGIASLPSEQHVFTRQNISLVSTVVSNLIWNICHATCFTNCTTQSRCPRGQSLGWQIFNDKMIVGNDFRKIDGVLDSVTCQNNCLQDTSCKSIEYIQRYKICNISRLKRSDVLPSEFVDQVEIEYHEWICILN